MFRAQKNRRNAVFLRLKFEEKHEIGRIVKSNRQFNESVMVVRRDHVGLFFVPYLVF